jgi:hypothetical protein
MRCQVSLYSRSEKKIKYENEYAEEYSVKKLEELFVPFI